MALENIDYDNLKKRGFLRQRQDGFFVLRTKMPSSGSYTEASLKELADIAKRYARGIVHATVRQGLEIPFVKYEDIPKVESAIADAGIEAGTSGPRLRATTVCPGNNWCKQGLVDTFYLAGRIERELGIKCGMDLPHKFKIAISGCPNGCTRPQYAEIGIHGQIDTVSPDKRIGYVIYLGGNGGRSPRQGIRLERIFTEDEVLDLIKNAVEFFRQNAGPRQRMGQLIEEFGAEKFLLNIGG